MSLKSYYRPKGHQVGVREKEFHQYAKWKPLMFHVPRFPEEQNMVADELLEWIASKPDNLSPARFFHEKFMSFQEFKRVTDKNEYCRRVIELVYEIISDRLMEAWRFSQVSTKFAMSFLAIYSPDFIAMLERMKPKQDVVASNGNVQYIAMEKIPDSDIVKVRE